MQSTTAYPLCWPAGYQKTPSYRRNHSRFDQTMDKAQRHLRNEVARLGGRNLIVSTNLRLRNDGELYAADLAKNIDEPGVAVYFTYKGKQVSMCCDQYLKVWENIYALGKGIEALRGMERWGVSEFLERAFTGFTPLPESVAVKPWWELLGISRHASAEELKAAYRQLVNIYHPDRPTGNAEKFIQVKKAYEEATDALLKG